MDKVESHRDTIKHLYELVFGGRMVECLQYFSDSCVLHEPQSVPYRGDYHGKSGYLEIGNRVFAAWTNLKADQLTLAAGDDYVMARFHVTATSPTTGRTWSMPFIEEFRFQDGKIVEVFVFYFDGKQVEWATGQSD